MSTSHPVECNSPGLHSSNSSKASDLSEISLVVSNLLNNVDDKRENSNPKDNQKLSCPNSETDAPVRRSSRIKRLTENKDNMVKTQSNKKGKGKKSTNSANKSDSLSSSTTPTETDDKSEGVKDKGSKKPKINKELTMPESKKVPRKRKKTDKLVDDDKRSEVSQENLEDKNDSFCHETVELTTASTASVEQTSDVTAEDVKPVKVKSRWWRSSELEGVLNSDPAVSEPVVAPSNITPTDVMDSASSVDKPVEEQAVEEANNKEDVSASQTDTKPGVPVYDHIEENIYRFARKKCKTKKQVRRMVCDCTLSKEEIEYGIIGCKDDCLNRLLMIECGWRCPTGSACSNKKFQKKEYIKAEIFKTEKKGWGLKTLQNISAGDFLMEFVGEVLNHKEYRQRVKQYAKEKSVHSYFMALKTDEILDATSKGNFTRFINHSCDPNCETQKWTVNGELRVGVFAIRNLTAGEELTLDYQFQRYGREAQKCFCGASNCSGFIGGAKQISVDAYGVNNKPTKKKRGLEDKKRDWEDMILEEEIEKLNDYKGLRNRDDTLKLARLMVRADDSATRHQLLDIILRTAEQACLRLFLDYHGLPLLWSWMTGTLDIELKQKILRVLSLLPISNKTMLLDSKVLSIIEKWSSDAMSGYVTESSPKDKLAKSASADCAERTGGQSIVKHPDVSDCETDSSGSQVNSEVIQDAVMTSVNASENSEASDLPPQSVMETSHKDQLLGSESNAENENSRLEITKMASQLLDSWKNLKEVFRIPRLEKQKRKEDELEVDQNAKEKVDTPPPVEVDKPGDQIQVVIGKNRFSSDRADFMFEEPDCKMQDRKAILQRNKLKHYSSQRGKEGANVNITVQDVHNIIVPNSNNITVPTVHNIPIPDVRNIPVPDVHNITIPDVHNVTVKEELPNMIASNLRPRLLPPPVFTEHGVINYPPPMSTTPLPVRQPLEQQNAPTVFPPQMFPQSQQVPYMGHNPPHLHNPPPNTMPNPTPILSQPPPMLQQQQQQQPRSTLNHPHSMPPSQPIPPNPSNFIMPPNAVGSPFIPGQHPPVQPGYNPGPGPTPRPTPGPVPGPVPNPFSNQGQPMYFIQQQGANPVPSSFPENIPVQQQQPPVVVQAPIIKEEPKVIKLPKNWRSATDSEGNVYYYHSVTRQTQWDPPTEDQISDDSEEDSESAESESSDTPTYDEPKVSYKHSKKRSKRKRPTKAAADTSVVPIRPEIAKKIKELFRTKMSTFIVHCLNAYRKSDCTVGRITNNDDFKYLARKLTHYTMTKELKQCKNVEDLDCNETVMHKAKDFIKKYMAKYGPQYTRKDKCSPSER